MEVFAVVTPSERTYAQVIKYVKNPKEFKRVSRLDDIKGRIFKGHFLMWDADQVRELDELLYWITERTKK